MVQPAITAYNMQQTVSFRDLCERLAHEITAHLPAAESKIWHGGPVWFLDGNPTVGYWVKHNKNQGEYVRLMFWSGADFKTPGLELGTGKFKDAHRDFTVDETIDIETLHNWLKESQIIQWDYKNLIKNKGVLERLS